MADLFFTDDLQWTRLEQIIIDDVDSVQSVIYVILQMLKRVHLVHTSYYRFYFAVKFLIFSFCALLAGSLCCDKICPYVGV